MLPKNCKSFVLKLFENWCRSEGVDNPGEHEARLFWLDLTSSDSINLQYHCGEPEFIEWKKVRYWLVETNRIKRDRPNA